MSTIRVSNERLGVLDLSGVQDVNGNPVVLQPKGTRGDTRECPREALDNPHLVRVRKAGWVTVSPAAAAAAEEKGPTFEEYIAAGYLPGTYPPHGYSEILTPGLTAYRAQAAAEAATKAAADAEAAEAVTKAAADVAAAATAAADVAADAEAAPEPAAAPEPESAPEPAAAPEPESAPEPKPSASARRKRKRKDS